MNNAIAKQIVEIAEANRAEMLSALMMCETDEGAAAFGSRDYAERRLRAINEIVREAIAKATGVA